MAAPKLDIEALEEPWSIQVNWNEDETDGMITARYHDDKMTYAFDIPILHLVGFLSLIEKTDMG